MLQLVAYCFFGYVVDGVLFNCVLCWVWFAPVCLGLPCGVLVGFVLLEFVWVCLFVLFCGALKCYVLPCVVPFCVALVCLVM